MVIKRIAVVYTFIHIVLKLVVLQILIIRLTFCNGFTMYIQIERDESLGGVCLIARQWSPTCTWKSYDCRILPFLFRNTEYGIKFFDIFTQKFVFNLINIHILGSSVFQQG